MSDSDIDAELIHGDAETALADMADNSVDAIVTDPPYGLAFMGRSWDDYAPTEYQHWCESWATEVKRVIKPGGHMLAFSGNRTHHRLIAGIEDAGWEIRDCLTWHHGEGFPKGHDIGKQIDKLKGTYDDREEVGEWEGGGFAGGTYSNENLPESHAHPHNPAETAPATPEAARWEGWNTQLKPATEFICLARAPFSEDTIAENVLRWETGALNIDACRIPTGENLAQTNGGGFGTDDDIYGENGDFEGVTPDRDGRHPSNLVLDAYAAALLDSQVGDLETCGGPKSTDHTDGIFGLGQPGQVYDDSGGPSRFFYCAKASPNERTHEKTIENDHPTVKPIDLMEHLVQLVSRNGQVVLDPFCGSGTTLLAAYNLGRHSIGIDQDESHVETAKQRLEDNEVHMGRVGSKPKHRQNSALDW